MQAALLPGHLAPLAAEAEGALIRQLAAEPVELPGAGGQLPVQHAVAGTQAVPHQLEPLALDAGTAEQRARLGASQAEIAQIELPASQGEGQCIVEGEHLELVEGQLAHVDLLGAPALPLLPPPFRQADVHAAQGQVLEGQLLLLGVEGKLDIELPVVCLALQFGIDLPGGEGELALDGFQLEQAAAEI